MISEKTLASNREHLESEIKRLKEMLNKRCPSPEIITEREKFFERVSTENTREMERYNHKATEKKLEDYKAALERMEKGGYGVCIDCGEEINEDRLIARPEASRCKECQEKKGLQVR